MKVNDISLISMNEVLKISKANEISIIADKDLKIVATGEAFQIVRIIDADIIETGSIVISKDIVKMLGKTGLIAIDDNVILSKSKAIKLENPSESSDFIEYNNFELITTIENDDFDNLVSGAYASAKDDARPILKGINFKVDNNSITTCALDGYRMAVRKKRGILCNTPCNFTVDKKTLEIAKNLRSDCKNLYIGRGRIKLGTDKFYIVIMPMKENFINYESLIDKGFRTRIKVDSKELLSLLKNYNSKLVEFDIGLKDGIKVMSKIIKNKKRKVYKNGKYLEEMYQEPIADVEDTVKCIWQGERIKVAFNPKYFIDALKDKKEEIEIRFINSISPITLIQDDKYDLVLPIRIVR